MLELIGQGWAMDFSLLERSKLFTVLLKQQVNQSGREEVLQALKNVPIDIKTASGLYMI
jgi:hypothetical protein